jgi:hypothetical protein
MPEIHEVIGIQRIEGFAFEELPISLRKYFIVSS